MPLKVLNFIGEKIFLQLVRPIDFVTFIFSPGREWKNISEVINRSSLPYSYINSSRVKTERGFRDHVSSVQFKNEKIEA